MLIGIFSDSHDNPHGIRGAVEVFNGRGVGLVIHLGDWVSPNMPHFAKGLEARMISLFGNNEGDKFAFLSLWQEIEFHNVTYEAEFDGRKIIAYHGQDKALLEGLLRSGRYDAVFSGHTHKAVNETAGNTLHLNPGSVGLSIWDKELEKRSVAVYDAGKNEGEIVELAQSA